MEVIEAIESRRSIRKYRAEPVSPRDIDRLLEAARRAPSTSNTQSWGFLVVTDPLIRKKLREAANNQKFLERAPVVIACCVDFDSFKEKGKRLMQLVVRGAVRPSLEMILRAARGGEAGEFDAERLVINGAINVSIATEHIVLRAQELGLGTCWVRAFDSGRVSEILDLPGNLALLALLAVGYAGESPSPRPRKQLEDIVI